MEPDIITVTGAITTGSIKVVPGDPAGPSDPPGYRDWRLISVTHEAGKLVDWRAVLGNDLAIEAKLRLPATTTAEATSAGNGWLGATAVG